jgi:hypothetical protein
MPAKQAAIIPLRKSHRLILIVMNKIPWAVYSRFRLRLFFFPAFFFAAAVTADDMPFQLPAEEMESTREELLSRVGQLRSFSGAYRLVQEWPQDTGRRPLVLDITCRFQEGNRFLTHVFTDPDGNLIMHTDALSDGKLSSLHALNDETTTTSGMTGLNEGQWLFPVGSLISPEMLFGKLVQDIPSLAAFFKEGETALFEYEGLRALYHYTSPYVLLVWLDQDDRITRYELSYSGTPLSEIRNRWPGNPFEIRQLFRTLTLEKYVAIDGIDFPAEAVLTVWDYNDQQFAALQAEYRKSDWDPLEFHIRACTQVELEKRMVQRFSLDTASARINLDLPQEAFMIEFPEEAVIWNSKGRRLDEKTLLQQYGLALAALLVMITGLAVAAGWYWQRKH